jgi:hypothetical protein
MICNYLLKSPFGSRQYCNNNNNGHYESVPNLVKNFNSHISKDVQSKIQLTYNKHTRKVTVDVKKQTSIWFTGDIAAALGFDQDSYITKKTTSPYTADIDGGFSSMIVYCNLASDQIVGDKKFPCYVLFKLRADTVIQLQKRTRTHYICQSVRSGLKLWKCI